MPAGKISQNFNEIAINEKRFARRVIYQLRAQNPPPIWHNLIPFRFVMEYFLLRRARIDFENNAMVVRKLALDAARSICEGENHEITQNQAARNIEEWLRGQSLYFEPVYEKQLAIAQTFEGHFSRLLRVDVKGYEAMVRAVYGSAANYRNFLDSVCEIERQIDDLVCELRSNAGNERQECRKKMKDKQQAFEKAREIELKRIFE